jgi:hypothetical protein
MRKYKGHAAADTNPERDKVYPSIPPAMLNENKPTQAHNRSHAAHLEDGSAEPHSKPEGDLRQGSYPITSRKQP